MNWDIWPVVVLAMTLLVAARPAMAAMSPNRTASAVPSRQALIRAGGGAAMLTLAAYLMTACRAATGFGFWDLTLQALSDTYLRTIPSVWTPALCWLFLTGAGAWWLFEGIKSARLPCDLAGCISGLNEVAIVGSLLLWNVGVPESWAHVGLFDFALHGLYIGFLAGGASRLVLALASFIVPAAEPSPRGGSMRSNSSLRRF